MRLAHLLHVLSPPPFRVLPWFHPSYFSTPATPDGLATPDARARPRRQGLAARGVAGDAERRKALRRRRGDACGGKHMKPKRFVVLHSKEGGREARDWCVGCSGAGGVS